MAKKPGNTISLERIFTVVCFTVGVLILAALLVPGFLAARKQEKLTICTSNLKTLGTALDLYTTGHDNHYPEELALLVPVYLDAIPICPGAGHDTYSKAYRALLPERRLAENEDGPQTLDQPGYFLGCDGHFHKDIGVAVGYPQYNDYRGLIEGPRDSRPERN